MSTETFKAKHLETRENDQLFHVPRNIPAQCRDLSDFENGSLKVLGLLGRSKFRSLVWLCLCSCGRRKAVPSANLLRAKNPTIRCGYDLARNPSSSNRAFPEGPITKQPWYERYRSMVRRCNDPKRSNYKHWGGRGIRVCDRWINNPWDYHKDVGDPPEKGMTLDRINNDGDYCPENVRWANPQDQIHNSRITKLDWETVRVGRSRVDSGESAKAVWRDISPPVGYENFRMAMARKTWLEPSSTYKKKAI